MSYILEALKKAQAERQLGNAPTIHAPAPSYAPPAPGGKRKPLLVGLGAGALVVAAGAAFMLRQPAAVPAVQVAAVPAPAVAILVPAPVAVPAQPAAEAPKPSAARATLPPAAPVAEPPRRADPEPARRADTVQAVPDLPRAAAPPAALSAPLSAALPVQAPSADDSVGPVQSLPEAVQRELPKVAFGGYIYSPNPAERLLLVDKTLRREGEEVAPGLVLERLLPKAAILNFRGYRYRVAY